MQNVMDDANPGFGYPGRPVHREGAKIECSPFDRAPPQLESSCLAPEFIQEGLGVSYNADFPSFVQRYDSSSILQPPETLGQNGLPRL